MHKNYLTFLLFILLPFVAEALTRTSVSSGNFNSSLTWDCGCVPATTDDIIVASGHTVDISLSTSCNDLTINSGGTISSGENKNLTINGNFVINGTFTGGNNPGTKVIMGGTNKTIDGLGTISTKGGIEFTTGSKTILSTANFSVINNVTITGAITLTNNGSVTVGGDVIGSLASSTWINGASSTLNLAGALLSTGTATLTASGNIVNFYLAGAQTIKSTSYHHLTISGSGVKTLGGNIVVAGDLNIISGTLDVSLTSYGISLGGNFVNQGVFTPQLGALTLNGSATQSLSSSSTLVFNNIVINKSTGYVDLLMDLNLSGTLTMTAGDIVTGSYKVVLGTATTTPGTLIYTSGAVVGTFERYIALASTGVGIIFPVGTVDYDRPATITFNSITTEGSILSGFSSISPGTAGLPVVDGAITLHNTFVDGLWSLSAANGFSSGNFNLNLTGTGFSAFPIDAETRLLSRTNSSSSWVANGTHAAASGVIANRNNLSILGEYAFGDDTNCGAPVTSAVSGPDSVCINESGIAYSVTNTAGSTYTWTITGGVQATGTNTNSITVNWGPTGTASAKVSVIEYNGCTNGAPSELTVAITAISPSSISGKSSVAQGTNGVPYSVTSEAGYSYSWVVTGGTIASGQNTAAISVNWGAAGSGLVEVTASNSCGSAAPVSLAVNKYIVINSVGTGFWGTASTWDCACIPSSTDNVRIKTTHTVTLSANSTIGSLVLEPGSTINDNNKALIVNGDFSCNGNYTGTRNITLNGSNVIVDGTGNISNSGTFTISSGSKTIEVGTSLTRSPGSIAIDAGLTITNKGSVTVAGDITGGSSSTSWINANNSTLNVGGALLSTGVLTASSTGNTVNYNGALTQNVKATTYYNLSTTGTAVTTLGSNLDANGNLNITGSLNANNFDISVAGNWVNTGTFTPGTGTVTFDGVNQTLSKAGGETFNNLIISGTGTITLASPITVNNDLTINSILNVSSSNYGINVKRNWINNGIFTQGAGLVTFNGTVAQTISGDNSFNNLTINNSLGVTISTGSQNLYGTLSLASGTFTTTGRVFTIKSNSSSTGRIGTVGTGTLAGNITMERYIAGGATGWNFLGGPVNSTIGDWNDDFATSGYTGSTGNAAGFVSVYTYDETVAGLVSNGYVAASNASETVEPGKGFWVFMGTSFSTTTDITVDAAGPPVIGDVSLPVSFTSSGGILEDGWNMVCNPYASTIDWNAAGWTKTNIDNAVYIYNPDIKDYATYVNGASTNSGSRYIASSQAFWVKANAASPVLTATESVKVVDNPSFFRTETLSKLKSISLQLMSNNMTDEAIVRFNDDASSGFDSRFDAYNLVASNPNPLIIFTRTNNVDYSVNTIKDTAGEIIIPVFTKRNTSGPMILNLNGVQTFPGCVTLEDLHERTMIDIKSNPSYSFHHTDTTAGPRFLLHFRSPVQVIIEDESCTKASDISFTLNTVESSNWSYNLFNDQDSLLHSGTSLTGDLILNNFSSGSYKLTLTSDQVCPYYADSFSVIESEPTIAGFKIDKDTVFLNESGMIYPVNLSQQADNFTWDFGDGFSSTDIQPEHLYTSSGTYTVSLLVSNGTCQDIFMKEVYVYNDESEVTSINELDLSNHTFNVNSNERTVNLNYNLPFVSDIVIDRINVLGQTLETRSLSNVQRGEVEFKKMENMGIGFFRIRVGDAVQTIIYTE